MYDLFCTFAIYTSFRRVDFADIHQLQWPLDNLHWTDHPSQFGQHTAPSDSEQLSTRDFKTAICELQSLITPGVRQLVQSSYPLHSNGYNFQEQSAYELYNQDEVRQYEYELHSQDEVRRYENGLHDQDEVRQYEYGLHDQDEVREYEDGLHGRDEVYQYDSPSMQAMEQHIEGPKSRDGQPKRNISPIEPIIRARIPSVGPVTGDVVANEFTALGSPSKPDREYYTAKDGKRRLKNLPGPLRREADLHIHYLTEQELREIRSNYDAHPSQTFQNPNGGTLHKTIAEDGRVTMELAKRVRVSNEEHDKWVE
jgi:hypothetical protein